MFDVGTNQFCKNGSWHYQDALKGNLSSAASLTGLADGRLASDVDGPLRSAWEVEDQYEWEGLDNGRARTLMLRGPKDAV